MDTNEGQRAPNEATRHVGGVKGTRKAPQLLRDMRRVYAGKEPAGGWTEAQQKLVKMFEANPEKFIDRLQRAEHQHRSGSKPAGQAGVAASEPKPAGGQEPDEGSRRARGHIEECLARIAAAAGTPVRPS